VQGRDAGIAGGSRGDVKCVIGAILVTPLNHADGQSTASGPICSRLQHLVKLDPGLPPRQASPTTAGSTELPSSPWTPVLTPAGDRLSLPFRRHHHSSTIYSSCKAPATPQSRPDTHPSPALVTSLLLHPRFWRRTKPLVASNTSFLSRAFCQRRLDPVLALTLWLRPARPL
jgi:hypothetical protein